MGAVVEALRAALEPDDIVLGGGNAKRLSQVPRGVRVGENANAFIGGLRLWEGADPAGREPITRQGKKE